ncbi:MAG: AEC family transporter [Gracilibacteraceae bacterium]|jgi:predicted permease|nr:AEC family transporter [Gracilibacteraceae bacterium]
MTDYLLLSLNTVAPIFFLILLGVFTRRSGMISENTAAEMNKAVFIVFLPVLLFNGLSGARLENAFRPGLLIFTAVALVLVWGLGVFLSILLIKDNKERGAVIQGFYHANFAFFGLSLAARLTDADGISAAGGLAVAVIPICNALTVLTLEFLRGTRPNTAKLCRDMFLNPLIIGTLAGFLLLFTGLSLPPFLASFVSSVATAASPLALVGLGAALSFSGLQKRGILALAVLGRLILVPLLVFAAAAALGFRGADMVALMAVFASPAAVITFVVAAQMDSDSELTAAIVASGSALSAVTVFFWVTVLKGLGLI